MKEYRTVSEISGPLIFVKDVEGVGYNELVYITYPDGSKRKGQVLDTKRGVAVVQVFEQTSGLDINTTAARFTGQMITLKVSDEMLGRVFDGMGDPRDGPPIFSSDRREIQGSSINPYNRQEADDFIQTGISALDGMNTLVRGQKLPIFSAAGLPHNEIAIQIARQAKVADDRDDFAVVFGAMGITHEEANLFITDLERTGSLEKSVMFLNFAEDPSIERLVTPRMALTTAEYLAYDLGYHVLVILTDITKYCESLREIGSARNEIPGRRGYPGYMYTDLAGIFERAGCVKGSKGTITQIPILTMPAGDITHPIPDLTGYITEGQIVLSNPMHLKNIYPPIDVLPCLSRLMNKGIGKDKTREDHKGVSDQLYALYAEGREMRSLSEVVGAEALTPDDRRYLEFAARFENEFIKQGRYEARSIEETLDIGWKLMAEFPETSLKRIPKEHLQKYLKKRT
ncbi:MAG: V-type ATP synthase subunit B [Candidatus Altiarchaeota archaeon]